MGNPPEMQEMLGEMLDVNEIYGDLMRNLMRIGTKWRRLIYRMAAKRLDDFDVDYNSSTFTFDFDFINNEFLPLH